MANGKRAGGGRHRSTQRGGKPDQHQRGSWSEDSGAETVRGLRGVHGQGDSKSPIAEEKGDVIEERESLGNHNRGEKKRVDYRSSEASRLQERKGASTKSSVAPSKKERLEPKKENREKPIPIG